MLCPYCQNNQTKVIDKRNTIDSSIRRRRQCIKCEKRFTTYEKIQNINLCIIKKSGEKQPFDREKLKQSFQKACKNTTITEEQIEKFVKKIETNLRKRKATEIPSKKLGDLVIKCLKKADEVAYIRFASVYKQFTDKKDFKKEIKQL